jgi:hypothetical protein
MYKMNHICEKCLYTTKVKSNYNKHIKICNTPSLEEKLKELMSIYEQKLQEMERKSEEKLRKSEQKLQEMERKWEEKMEKMKTMYEDKIERLKYKNSQLRKKPLRDDEIREKLMDMLDAKHIHYDEDDSIETLRKKYQKSYNNLASM